MTCSRYVPNSVKSGQQHASIVLVSVPGSRVFVADDELHISLVARTQGGEERQRFWICNGFLQAYLVLMIFEREITIVVKHTKFCCGSKYDQAPSFLKTLQRHTSVKLDVFGKTQSFGSR